MAGYAGGGGGGGRFPWGGYGDAGETLATVMARRAPRPGAIRPEAIRAAERAAREVVRRVQPTAESEQRREAVIGYARRLVGSALGCEVYAFGSVPLKTYLPDGDVDLTVLGNTFYDSTLVNDVRCVLESEEQNSDAEFEVKGLQYINAEVRLIKCVIENIIVDISFNQIGGVCTFCFLELVDRQVGKNHLFKRSILLIKSWCYHESRILGAHHGLISTYALETLVLYIFNIFHKSLHGPLEVLYKFLEYFSKFDWDNYCISLNGPVALSSLPNLIVEPTFVHDELLFDKEFLKGSVDRLIVPPKGSDGCYTKFRLKHLNIIDPLKGNNNLGRSVSRASFYRIRSAFSFGAQKLGQILMLPSELIPDEVYRFFTSTLERHGKGERPDLGNYDSFQSYPGKTLQEDMSSMKISYMNKDENRSPHHLSLTSPDKEPNVKINRYKNSDRHVPGDAQDHPWNKIWFRKSAGEDHKVVPGAISAHFAPKQHSTFSRENGNGNNEQCSKDYVTEEEISHSPAKLLHVDTRSFVQQQIYATSPSHILTSSTRTNTLEVSNSSPIYESNWAGPHVEKLQLPPFSPSSLLDLTGDLDMHLRCLRQVQYHLEYLFDGFLQSVQEASSAGILDEDSFNIPAVSILLNVDATLALLSAASPADTDGRNLSPVSCSHSTGDTSQQSQDEDRWDVSFQQKMSLPSETDVPSNWITSSSSFAADSENFSLPLFPIIGDIPKTRGTGTYIPKMSYDTYKERMTTEKARKQNKKLTDQLSKIQKNPRDKHYKCKDSFELGSSCPSYQHITFESTTYQVPMKQNNSQLDGHSSKSLAPSGGFVSSKERAMDYGSKQMPKNQPWKFQDSQHGYFCSNKIEKKSCDTDEELVRPDKVSREIPMYQPPDVQHCFDVDVCSNKNMIEKTSYEYVSLATATKLIPNYQPLTVQDTKDGSAFSDNLSEKQSYETLKDTVRPDCPTKQIPTYEPLNLRNIAQDFAYSNKNLMKKGSYVNHKVHLNYGTADKKIQGEVSSNNDLAEKGSELTPLSPKMLLSHCGGNGKGKLSVYNTCQPSFPVTKGYSQIKDLETQAQDSLEFGSLGPISLRLFPSKLVKPSTYLSTNKGAAEAASKGQSSSDGTTQSRPPGVYQLRDEVDFPPLHAAGSR